MQSWLDLVKSIPQNPTGTVSWLCWPRRSMSFFAFTWAQVRQWFDMLWSFSQCSDIQAWGELSSDIFFGDKHMAGCRVVSQFWLSTFGMQILPWGKIHHLLWIFWVPKLEYYLISSGLYLGTSSPGKRRGSGIAQFENSLELGFPKSSLFDNLIFGCYHECGSFCLFGVLASGLWPAHW